MRWLRPGDSDDAAAVRAVRAGFRGAAEGEPAGAALDFEGPCWRTAPAFGDGDALWQTVLDFGLQGVVAKRVRDPYRPGERGWLKRKNPNGPRFQEEREAAIRLARKVFV